jgi:hypothetical protein
MTVFVWKFITTKHSKFSNDECSDLTSNLSFLDSVLVGLGGCTKLVLAIWRAEIMWVSLYVICEISHLFENSKCFLRWPVSTMQQ